MGLAFLVPAFLAGVLALAIPVWVHLRNRTKTEAVEFPSLMFLEQIPYRSIQRQALRHRALFALRCLALALLILAFARPFFGDGTTLGSRTTGAREVVVLIDDSWSMGYGSRWQIALDAALDAVATLSVGDRVSVVRFDDAASVLVESATDFEAASGALRTLVPGAGATDMSAGLRVASRILAESSAPRREVVLVSDFQRVGWDPESDPELPETAVLRTVYVGGEAAENRSVAALTFERSADVDGNDALAVSARITRQGGDAPAPVTATLRLDTGATQTRTIEVEPNGATLVAFDAVPAAQLLRGSVALDADALAADDEFFFVASPAQAVRVLLLDNPSAGPEDSLYVERSLAVSAAPVFRVESAILGDLTPRDLTAVDLVILNDVGSIDDGTASTLLEFVDGGGGLLVAYAERSVEAAAGTESPWGFAAAGVEDRSDELGATLASIERDHPIFEPFREVASGDLAAARFYRYRRLEPIPQAGVLARYDDGRAALVEVARGAGRILIWTSSLDTFWTDFPLKPVFVPVIHEAAQHAAGYREAQAWLPAGRAVSADEVVAAVPQLRDQESAPIELVRGADAPIVLQPGQTARLQPGQYTATSGTLTSAVAANVDRGEADLTAIDPEELAAAVVYRAGGDLSGSNDDGVAAADIEARQSTWWYLIVAAAIALLAETALSNRMSTGASSPRGATPSNSPRPDA